MSRNAIVALVVIVAVVGGAIWYFAGQKPVTTPPENATSTVSTSTNTNTPPPARQPAAPVAVTDANASPSDTTVVVTGKVTPNGTLTTYWFEYGPTASMGSKTNSQAVGSGYAAISAPAYITGLTANTTYYFRLIAQNVLGTSTGAQYSFKTTQGNPPPVGSAPTAKTLAASGISRTTANLNGEVTPNKVDTLYWFEYGNTTDFGTDSAFQSAGNGTAKVAVTISASDLTPVTTYYFRLNAQNQFGTINGAILNFKTAGPAAPAQPTVETSSATNVSTSTVTLRGTVNPNGADTQYWFEYSTDSLLGSVLANATDKKSTGAGTSVMSVSADLTGLTPKTTYNFRIVAQNNLGTIRGTQMSVTTK